MSKVLEKVISDLGDREALGIKKYGTDCDRADYDLIDWLQEAYEENLDAAMYLKAAIELIKSKDKFY
jgi:hypothetical protein